MKSKLIWAAVGGSTQSLFTFFFLLYSARLLGPEKFGVIVLSLSLLSIVKSIPYSSYQDMIVKRIAIDKEYLDKLDTSLFALSFIVMVLLYGLALAVSGFSLHVSITLWVASGSAFLFQVLAARNLAILVRDQRFKDIAKISALSYLFSYVVVGVPLLILMKSYWAVLFAITTNSFLEYFFSKYLYFRSNRFEKNVDAGVFQDMCSYTFGRTGQIVGMHADKLLVGAFFGLTGASHYRNAIQIVSLPNVFFSRVLEKYSLSYIAANNRDDPSSKPNAFMSIYRFALFFMCIAGYFLIENAVDLIALLLGDGWDLTVHLLQLASGLLVIKLSIKINEIFLRVLGNNRDYHIYSFSQVALLIICSGVGVMFSLETFAMLVVVAFVISSIVIQFLVGRVLALSIRFYLLNFLVVIAAFAIALTYMSVFATESKNFIYQQIYMVSITATFFIPLIWMVVRRYI